jgi:hypothetical protein
VTPSVASPGRGRRSCGGSPTPDPAPVVRAGGVRTTVELALALVLGDNHGIMARIVRSAVRNLCL